MPVQSLEKIPQRPDQQKEEHGQLIHGIHQVLGYTRVWKDVECIELSEKL